ncbi:unnamed protein product [Lampetra planeri]
MCLLRLRMVPLGAGSGKRGPAAHVVGIVQCVTTGKRCRLDLGRVEFSYSSSTAWELLCVKACGQRQQKRQQKRHADAPAAHANAPIDIN